MDNAGKNLMFKTRTKLISNPVHFCFVKVSVKSTKRGCAVYKPSFHSFVLFCYVSVSLRLIEHYNSEKLIEAFSFLAISQANSSWF